MERVELADVVSTEALDELPNSAGVCSAHRQIADDSHLCVSLLFSVLSAPCPQKATARLRQSFVASMSWTALESATSLRKSVEFMSA